MDGEAVRELLNAGSGLVDPRKTDIPRTAPYIVIHDSAGNEAVHWLSDAPKLEAQYTASITAYDQKSLVALWKKYATKASTLYARQDPASFMAVFNDIEQAQADYRDFTAAMNFSLSREWKDWLAQDRKPFKGNVAFAEWLEDRVNDFSSPAGADMLQIALNFKASETLTFGKAYRLEDGQTQFTYQTVNDAGSNVNGGTVAIPAQFTIGIPVFHGLGQPLYQVTARFRYRLTSDGLSVWYALINPQKVIDQAFADAVSYVSQQIGSDVIFGWPF